MKYKLRNGWTKRRMIQEIKKHMLDHPSMTDVGCVYRAPDGNRCAVGVFLKDEDYESEMDEGSGYNAKKLCTRFPHIKAYLPLGTAALLKLQAVHDNCHCEEDPRPKLIAWIKKNVA